MNEFPEGFNIQSCMKIIEHNQHRLTKEVRKEFYTTINESVNDCNKKVELKFPDNLWDEYRIKITTEILERFGEIRAKREQQLGIEADMIINDITEIPRKVEIIIIEFCK